jgi:hypothetical protein
LSVLLLIRVHRQQYLKLEVPVGGVSATLQEPRSANLTDSFENKFCKGSQKLPDWPGTRHFTAQSGSSLFGPCVTRDATAMPGLKMVVSLLRGAQPDFVTSFWMARS